MKRAILEAELRRLKSCGYEMETVNCQLFTDNC